MKMKKDIKKDFSGVFAPGKKRILLLAFSFFTFIFYGKIEGSYIFSGNEEALAASVCDKMHNSEKIELSDGIILRKNITYGNAKGYYTSKPVDETLNLDYSPLLNEMLTEIGKTFNGRNMLPLVRHEACVYKYLIVCKLQSTKFAVQVEVAVMHAKETRYVKLMSDEFVSCNSKASLSY